MTYLRKMHEIDLLKYLLLEEYQIDLLNFISKPSVSLLHKSDIFESMSRKMNTDIDNTEVDNIFECYNTIKEKKNPKNIDIKLLRLFKNEVETLMN